MTPPLRVLAVDDLPPALEELTRLLRAAPEVGEVTAVGDPLGVVKQLRAASFDAVFLDIAMPGLDGMELAGLLNRLGTPPVIVFVTAHDQHAVDAYGLGAVDYLLKPVRAERLADALTKVGRMVRGRRDDDEARPAPDRMPALAVESEGRTRYVRREEVRFAEAQGDYVRLHTGTGVHEVRIPLTRLEEYWAHAGFLRVHRGYLVALGAVRELRSDAVGGVLAHTDSGDVPVSRRHARELRERLLRAAEQGGPG